MEETSFWGHKGEELVRRLKHDWREEGLCEGGHLRMWAGMAGVGTEGARKVPESGWGGARSPVEPGGARLALGLEVVSEPRALLREERHGEDRVVAVDKNGDVCISILHEPGEDKYGYEKPEERWLPIHTVETIMISVISMLADPNGDSPANVDAAGLQLRNTALFPCTLPTYRWTSVVTSWQTLAGSGLR
ncbi:ubiquitin-conjugating enzyme E2 G1 isoform X1 [Felis catus]|uniref:ubiquitin-conjugating enzyme E2 G1 isoform X1 n=1 Tax=Felis catus TaxID=9685 RepID=UPI001D19FBA0|nr:ubiquitin-conjugating enzyme E2 G1 isoform X1 [Felis catus]